MSPFKVLYLCTLYQYQFSLAYCEWLSVCSTSRHLNTVWKLHVFFCFVFFFLFLFFFFLSFCPKSYLNVNFDDTVEKIKIKKMNKDRTVPDSES